MVKAQAAWTTGLAMTLGLAGSAWAGPPYVTDDPETTELHKWEIYAFTGGSHVKGVTGGAGGLDLNYGAAKDLQLTLVFPSEYENSGRLQANLGDVEMAAKVKFLHQDDAGLDLAFFPRVFLPTAPRQGAPKQASLLLPIWAGKDFGEWSLFGGGGYVINPGPGNRDFWQGGVAVTKDVSERVNLGGEVYFQSADVAGGKGFAGVNLGISYKLTDHLSLLGAAGPGVKNARDNGRYDYYLSLKLDY
jgi:hypothetical protein